MSSASTPATERDQQLLGVGKQCSLDTCNLVDFLPFKCQHCTQPFCAEHYRPQSHQCKEFDEAKYDRMAPNCPLCNQPVAVPQGQDPNIRMEEHINTKCSVMTGKKHSPNGPKCANRRCGKALFAPIRCGTNENRHTHTHLRHTHSDATHSELAFWRQSVRHDTFVRSCPKLTGGSGSFRKQDERGEALCRGLGPVSAPCTTTT